MSDNYLKVLWTCGMGEACTNTTRPGTHEEYSAASVCCGRQRFGRTGEITVHGHEQDVNTGITLSADGDRRVS
jgi:hypothetical protein